MTDQTPSIVSNSEAAKRACHAERERVLAILSSAEGAVPQPIMEAIANGTPSAIALTNARRRETIVSRAGGDRPRAGGGKWDAITKKFKAHAPAAEADEAAR